jgi:hypothetical protein
MMADFDFRLPIFIKPVRSSPGGFVFTIGNRAIGNREFLSCT